MTDETIKVDLANLPEAPASINVKVVDNDGYLYQITLRDLDEGRLMERMRNLKLWLASKHFTPPGGGKVPTQTTDWPTDMESPVQAEKVGDAPREDWCSIHNTEMYRREKDGKVWYSHKPDDGPWCKGYVKE